MNRKYFTAATCSALFVLAAAQPALAQENENNNDFRLRASYLSNVAVTEDDIQAEIEFGKNIAARVLGRVPLYDDPQITRYVNLVGKAVALHSNRPEIEFRFAILDTDDINAYSAPGGYVFITKGSLKTMKDEAELAGVLAHEIAHVTEKHIVREFNVRGTETSALGSLSRLIGGSQDSARVAFSQAVDKAMDVLFETGFKQEDELDADRIATLLLATTGYDPSALRRYLSRLQLIARKHAKAVGATHPPTAQRLKSLDGLIKTEGLDSLRYPSAAKRFKVNANLR